MSNAKLFLTDWRGPAAWSSGDRARAGAMLSCGPTWGNVGYQQKPIAGMPTLIGGALCYATFNGLIPGSPGDAIYDICTEGVTRGYHLLPMIPTGKVGFKMVPCRTYAGTDPGNGGNETFAWNMARPDVCRWLAQQYADRYSWADGLHIDYWVALSGIAADQDLNPGYSGLAMTDLEYMRGMNRFVHDFRRRRAAMGLTTFVIGQEWQNGNNAATTMRELNGRYVEQDPDRWVTNQHGAGGYSSWASFHQAQLNSWPTYTVPHTGNKGSMVIEMAVRAAGQYLNKPYPSSGYQSDVMTFADSNACYVSWGRDDQAGIGWPG